MNLDFKTRPIFLIGALGSGMSSLAQIFLDYGANVYGQDAKENDLKKGLEAKGMKFINSLKELYDKEFSVCVYSSAIDKQTNEYYQHFSKTNSILMHRSKALHEIFKEKKTISVAGSHGKTSTTTMIAEILEKSNREPSFMIGGEPGFSDGIGGRYSLGEFAVYESDESDGTFLNHDADYKVLTNIDNDHLDYYKNREGLNEAFSKYLENPNSKKLVCLDDLGIQELLKENKFENIRFYSSKVKKQELEEIVSFQILNSKIEFSFQNKIYLFSMPYPGNHYLKNALAAILTTELLGVPIETSISILENYSGVKRRFEFLGENLGIKVFDDYGHHPTEIEAVIHSVHSLNKKAAIIFQPHRFTRTRDLYLEFAKSLSLADKIFLLPIYSAGEKPIEGINTELISKEIPKLTFQLTGEITKDMQTVRNELTSDFILVSLGAGNVREWGNYFLKEKT
ncbi:MAG: UDP-N-acetylmuramate--L-alanine ligase [Leptospiraceae bacterium]|nr:UDP-N-acetylmuramate--L-alanine ligase [Leptospiraceae bacterium]